MLKRTISGIVLFILVTASVLISPLTFGLVLLIFSLIAVNELSKALGVHSEGIKANPLEITMYISTICLYVVAFLNNVDTIDAYTMIVLIATFLILMAIYVLTFPKYQATEIAKSIFIVVYGPLLLSFGYRIEAFAVHPFVTVGLIFIVSSVCDIAAYFVGSAIGKHKLAPELSPKKTIEGAIGGVVVVTICCIVYGIIMHRLGILMGSHIIRFSIIGIAGSIISQLGDLAASAIKRNYGIKDYGKIIPGHGGIMDRVDSWIVVMPIIYMITVYFNTLT